MTELAPGWFEVSENVGNNQIVKFWVHPKEGVRLEFCVFGPDPE